MVLVSQSVIMQTKLTDIDVAIDGSEQQETGRKHIQKKV